MKKDLYMRKIRYKRSDRKMKYKTLKDMLSPIFENSELWEVDLIFSPEVELDEQEFKELIQNAILLQQVINNKIYSDFYEWWEFENQYLELEIDYYRYDDKIFVLELHFWREEKK
ncbi:hypothetical protein [Sulfolobus islandicus rudivirus 1 variant XX]|uniref:Uncharacterized protein n=1 Tax=Sulfolobus islandicus rod-shaped virus 1 TaxID=157898 RepID=Q5TJ73_SIRV1|nr:hypothetical protein [Sulfolobus islandicus rudivirus 1 variant XX]